MIGIGIVTWQRHERLLPSIVAAVGDLTLSSYELFVGCDSPEALVAVRAMRLPCGGGVRRGVAANKNRVFAWFADRPFLSHLFLFEDDTFPVKQGWDDWWLGGHAAIPEVQAACWQPVDFYNGPSRPGLKIARGGYVAMPTHNDGMAMLSITRAGFEKVGGMHPAFRVAGYGNEHSEYMTRARRAGIVPWTNCTFQGCEEHVDSVDYREWRHARGLPGGEPRPAGDPAGSSLLFAKNQPHGLATFCRVSREEQTYHDPHWEERQEWTPL